LKEGRKLQAELRDKLAAGWRPGKATVAGYAERWLEELAEARDWRDARRPNTILRYHQALRLYIVPVLGSRKLSDVDAFAVKELRRLVPPSQSPYVLTVLASMYREAIEDDVATHNPVRGMLPKRVERSEARHLSEDEFRRLVAIVRGHRLEGAVILGLCGLRISEAVSMTWGDMDLDTGEITVPRQFFGELKAGQRRHVRPIRLLRGRLTASPTGPGREATSARSSSRRRHVDPNDDLRDGLSPEPAPPGVPQVRHGQRVRPQVPHAPPYLRHAPVDGWR
jgi:integrase